MSRCHVTYMEETEPSCGFAWSLQVSARVTENLNLSLGHYQSSPVRRRLQNPRNAESLVFGLLEHLCPHPAIRGSPAGHANLVYNGPFPIHAV